MYVSLNRINKLGNTILNCITDSIVRLINSIASSFQIVFPNLDSISHCISSTKSPLIVLEVHSVQEHFNVQKKTEDQVIH